MRKLGKKLWAAEETIESYCRSCMSCSCWSSCKCTDSQNAATNSVISANEYASISNASINSMASNHN
ncbi:CLI_3235 family bacteriocin precursor [Gorillibacterium sp. sgz500922]|uniref:CLI_3235 family bacteriocin precursor n=1 Tax=Gorillibacterium sp. sgz500922 TaxID=3446694 RepID=UPI003F66EC78